MTLYYMLRGPTALKYDDFLSYIFYVSPAYILKYITLEYHNISQEYTVPGSPYTDSEVGAVRIQDRIFLFFKSKYSYNIYAKNFSSSYSYKIQATEGPKISSNYGVSAVVHNGRVWLVYQHFDLDDPAGLTHRGVCITSIDANTLYSCPYCYWKKPYCVFYDLFSGNWGKVKACGSGPLEAQSTPLITAYMPQVSNPPTPVEPRLYIIYRQNTNAYQPVADGAGQKYPFIFSFKGDNSGNITDITRVVAQNVSPDSLAFPGGFVEYNNWLFFFYSDSQRYISMQYKKGF